MQPDRTLLREEAREEVKRALLSYPHPIHVTLYVLKERMDWNDLLHELANTDAPSDPEEVSEITSKVEDHLRNCIHEYLQN